MYKKIFELEIEMFFYLLCYKFYNNYVFILINLIIKFLRELFYFRFQEVKLKIYGESISHMLFARRLVRPIITPPVISVAETGDKETKN